jgi:hypothetical protein
MRLHPDIQLKNATTLASLPILARKMRWHFEKTIFLKTDL